MEGIILTDDQLKLLEKRFGHAVRKMGSWNSDGTFGYSWISMAVVEKAAESINNRGLTMALSRLKDAPDPTMPFIALLETFGPRLLERIVDLYRQGSLELALASSLANKPSGQELERESGSHGISDRHPASGSAGAKSETRKVGPPREDIGEQIRSTRQKLAGAR
jgi:hypothetical protein